MKKLSVGVKVSCKSDMYSGEGVVQELFPNEMLGVQVLLDHGDSDGHRSKRFRMSEVTVL